MCEGVLRLIRGALTFQMGIETFMAVDSAVTDKRTSACS